MTYVLLALTLIIGILNVSGLFSEKFKLGAWALCFVLFASFIISLLVERKRLKEEKYAKNHGVMEGEIKEKGIIYPGLKVGESVLVYTGTDYGVPFKGVDLRLWIEDSKIYLSTSTRSANGELVARIIRNEWQVNQNNYFDKNFDEKAIEVIDKEGNIILQAEFNGTNSVNFAGVVYAEEGHKLMGNEDAILFQPARDGSGNGSMIFFRKGQKPPNEIKPLFRYPSALHMGERAK